jgi:hypothetical protein
MNTRRMVHRLLLPAALLCLGAAAATQAREPMLARYQYAQARGLSEYRNERFGFAVVYRAGYWVPQPPPANGDGRTFRSSDGAELRVWASHNALEESLAGMERRARADFAGGRITYRTAGRGWFVLSGLDRGGQLVYRATATFARDRDTVATMLITYPAAARAVVDPDIAAMWAHLRRSMGR